MGALATGSETSNLVKLHKISIKMFENMLREDFTENHNAPYCLKIITKMAQLKIQKLT
jgi:hypothetical protein